MKRIHAFEWEDQSWFPDSWRAYGTNYLRFIATTFHIYKPIIPILKRGIEAGTNQEWVDCASGGGGGLIRLAKDLQQDYPNLKITMTDYYPNIKAFERTQQEVSQVFTFEAGPVNAMELPAHLHGKFRTMFGAFHHFRPADARKILQNAVNTASPIAIFEPVARNAPSLISMLFVILNVLIFTPFIRPVIWSTLPFIYLLPLIPLYILWDGVVSIFRTYSMKELREMVSSLHNTDSFTWEIGKTSGPVPVHYLLGTKK